MGSQPLDRMGARQEVPLEERPACPPADAVGRLPSSVQPRWALGPTVAECTGPCLSLHAQCEGWVRLVGDDLPPPLVSGQTDQDSWLHTNMLSEATASSRRRHPDSSAVDVGDRRTLSSVPEGSLVTQVGTHMAASAATAPPPPSTSTSQSRLAFAPGAMWMSLCRSLLFFSAGPEHCAPFAFVHLRTMQFTGVEPTRFVFSIDGGPEETCASGRMPLQMVFLLPDGRWQCFSVPSLSFELCDRSQLENWVLYLSELCNMGHDCYTTI